MKTRLITSNIDFLYFFNLFNIDGEFLIQNFKKEVLKVEK